MLLRRSRHLIALCLHQAQLRGGQACRPLLLLVSVAILILFIPRPRGKHRDHLMLSLLAGKLPLSVFSSLVLVWGRLGPRTAEKDADFASQ